MKQFKKCLIIKHKIEEGPGIIEDILKEMGILYKIIELENGEKLPEDIKNIDFIFSLGGPMNVYQEREYPFLKEEEDLIKKIYQFKKHFLGICLGAQILAKTFGAKVNLNFCKEIGFFEVELTENGKKDNIFTGVSETFTCFQYHSDCFELPENGILLVKGKKCLNQGFKIGENLYGFQFHIEINKKLLFDFGVKKVYYKKLEKIKETGEIIIKNFLKKEG
ncbi:MAG TPA: type 1 glutamine amidotransferase [bacterium]|nr:type 1 glutamine amidotransferase [bacterium]HOM27456.1 type 1 glutamine amidotransferase [bacterium]